MASARWRCAFASVSSRCASAEDPVRKVSTRDARILRFEGVGNLLVLLGGKSGVPDHLAFALGALEQDFFAIRAAVRREIGRRCRLCGLAPGREGAKSEEEKNQAEDVHRANLATNWNPVVREIHADYFKASLPSGTGTENAFRVTATIM